MTREAKINWLMTASNEDVINQLKWSVIAMTNGDYVSTRIAAQEDYDLVVNELKKRLNKEEA